MVLNSNLPVTWCFTLLVQLMWQPLIPSLPTWTTLEGFYRETEYIHQLGFDGKSLVNPRQIEMVNKVYEPTEKEVLNAKNVINAIEEARLKRFRVISMNGQMVDRPVVLRAQRVMRLAKASNLVDEEGNYIEK